MKNLTKFTVKQGVTMWRNNTQDRSHKAKQNIDVCETLMPPFPNMTFDLDLWPTDLKINRDHLLIKDYLPTYQVWSF